MGGNFAHVIRDPKVPAELHHTRARWPDERVEASRALGARFSEGASNETQRRQTFDLPPWHDAGEQALQQAHVRQTLEQLDASVRERLDRVERSRSSPNNLIKHNSAFVGRVRELTELRNALNENC